RARVSKAIAGDRCAGDTEFASNNGVAAGLGPAYLEDGTRPHPILVATSGPVPPKELIMAFELPPLPYAYDALGTYMSKETLEFHHDKHHQAYVTNGNNAIKGTEWENTSLEEIVKGSHGKSAPVFNNAGQHYNHIHFWKWMKPGGGGDKIPGALEKQIVASLGPVAQMEEDFIQA